MKIDHDNMKVCHKCYKPIMICTDMSEYSVSYECPECGAEVTYFDRSF